MAIREGKRKNGDKLQPKEEKPLEEGSYPFKTQGYIFLNSIKADLNKFIQAFLDDEQQHLYTSKPREHHSGVKLVTAENFEREVLKGHDAKHMILEVFKEHCGACSFNKPVF